MGIGGLFPQLGTGTRRNVRSKSVILIVDEAHQLIIQAEEGQAIVQLVVNEFEVIIKYILFPDMTYI